MHGMRNSFKYLCANNYQYRIWFDRDIEKIKRVKFFVPRGRNECIMTLQAIYLSGSDLFSNNRTQQLKIKNTLSHSILVTDDVQQGSGIWPVRFLFCVSDMVDCFDNLQCTVKLHADDAYRLCESISSLDNSNK